MPYIVVPRDTRILRLLRHSQRGPTQTWDSTAITVLQASCRWRTAGARFVELIRYEGNEHPVPLQSSSGDADGLSWAHPFSGNGRSVTDSEKSGRAPYSH
jgi:hypothetical protein